MSGRRWLALVILLAAFARPVRADEVFLSDGRVVEGDVTELGDKIKVSGPLGAVYFEKTAVSQIRRGPTRRQRYADMEAVAGGDAASHFAIAEWCEKKGLQKEMKTELEHALARDPNHREAHQKLGHVFQDNRWMTQAEANTARGLVLYKGDWLTPEERDAVEAVAARKAQEAKLRKEAGGYLDKLASKDEGVRDDAAKQLAGIPLDVLKPVLRGAMQHRDAGVRRYAAAALASDPDKSDLDRFVRMALRDTEVQNSALAFQALSRMGDVERQRMAFVSALAEREPLVVMRAASALEACGDKSCVAALVGALDRSFELTSWGFQHGVIRGGVTRGEEIKRGSFLNREELKSGEHLEIQTPVMGGVDPELLKGVRNAVLSALKKITGKSFGDNLALWHWYVEQMRAIEAARSVPDPAPR